MPRLACVHVAALAASLLVGLACGPRFTSTRPVEDEAAVEISLLNDEYSYQLSECAEKRSAAHCRRALIEAEELCYTADSAAACLEARKFYAGGVGTPASAAEAERLQSRACGLGRCPDSPDSESYCIRWACHDDILPIDSPRVDGDCNVGQPCKGACIHPEYSCGDHEPETLPRYTASGERIRPDDEPSAGAASTPWGGTRSSGPNCKTGKRCGNSCIAAWKTCHK